MGQLLSGVVKILMLFGVEPWDLWGFFVWCAWIAAGLIVASSIVAVVAAVLMPASGRACVEARGRAHPHPDDGGGAA
ncbi:MAG: hypothetical protein IJR14_12190 [Synergistaceae bacterium]|nr:hypothetical protein [Synergistaceae bacterium]